MTKESILIRPTNITTIITNLLALLKVLVIPKLNPTVLYAEKHSKAISTNFFSGSNIEISIIATPITSNDNDIMANDLRTETSAISRLKSSILDLPLAKLHMLSVAIANVLVLIPPPVDCGEAPIHIKRKTIMSVGKAIDAVSIELKPAVLGVVAPKSAVTIFPKPLCSAKVLWYSRQ